MALTTTHSKLSIFVYLVLFLCHVSLCARVRRQLAEGEACSIEGVSGKCVSIRNCPRAIQDLRKNVVPKTCSFNGKTPIVCCSTSVSEAKCKEYEEIKVGDGQVFYSVVGGTNARLGQYPHMAALGYQGKSGQGPQWQCGGSLISLTFVLTAAHCLEHRDFGPVSVVRLGDVKLDGLGTTHADYKVIRRIPHPQYRRPSVYHDIALIELEKPIRVTENIRPACLEPSRNSTEYDVLTATGWGLLEFGGNQPNNLQEVTLSSFTKEECSNVFKKRGRLNVGVLDEFQFCYGGRNEEKDTCSGDSGGPLSLPLKNKFHKIVGVTSLGKSCGVANVPGLYTRVSSYVPWIESVVWP